MNEFWTWASQFSQSLTAALGSIAAYLPYLLAALLLMLLGWMLARLLRFGALRLSASLSGVLERASRSTNSRTLSLSPALRALIGNIVFWVVILLFAALATRVARLEAFSGWLDRLIIYLPTFVAGALIVLAGYLLSTLVRDLVAAALVSAGAVQLSFVAMLAQGAVFFTAVVIGLDQIGIDVSFLTTLLAVTVGGGLLGLAIAFGLGARGFVSNLIAAHSLERQVERNQLARLGDIEGRVLELTPTHVVLLSERGKLLVPARLFQEQVVFLADSQDE